MLKAPFRSYLAASLLGGAIVALAFFLIGDTARHSTQTIIEQSPVGQVVSSSGSGLTPHEIYVRDAPGVVFIRAQVAEQLSSPFGSGSVQRGKISTGSGFLIDPSGHILTDYHLIQGADARSGVTVKFDGEVSRRAQVVGQDPDDDLALLSVSMTGLPGLEPLALGDSATVRVGDPALAIGNPFGLDRTLTSGIVSALQRRILGQGGFSIDNVIQTDTPSGSGGSGGPLLDAAGRVIGVSSQISTGPGGLGPVAFAIPINTAKELLPRMEGRTQVQPAYLGVRGAPAPGRRPGVVIRAVVRGGPGDSAGLRAGDDIEAIDGEPVNSMSDVQALVESHPPGIAITLQTVRAHRRRTVKALLGSRAAG